MKNTDIYAELEYQRRHLLGAEGKGREMVMCGINRLLDSLLDAADFGPGDLPPSAEGQAHIEKGWE